MQRLKKDEESVTFMFSLPASHRRWIRELAEQRNESQAATVRRAIYETYGRPESYDD